MGRIFSNSTTWVKNTFRKIGTEGAIFKTQGSNCHTGSIGNNTKKKQIKKVTA